MLENDDFKILKMLFAKFLKKHKIMAKMYKNLYDIFIVRNKEVRLGSEHDMYINYRLNNLIFPETDDLVMSQLWRFYLLENINLFNTSIREIIKRNTQRGIENNGTRGSEELEKLFDKYNISKRKIWI